jgi:hypothetical protein
MIMNPVRNLSLLVLVAVSAALLSTAACKKNEAAPAPEPFAPEPDAGYTQTSGDEDQSPIIFADITKAAGIEFTHVTGAFGQKWMPETIGSGGGFLDYDGDEKTDIFLVNSTYWPGHGKAGVKSTPKLYRNQGDGTFDDVTSAADLGEVSVYGMGCAFADFDADGDQDIYVTAVGNNLLLRNDAGRFVDVAEEFGVVGHSADAKVPSWSTSAAWLDYNGDGWLDLFVCNYVQWTPETDIYTTFDGKSKSYATPDVYKGQSCRLYRNIDGKSFQDVTEDAGVLNEDAKSLGVAVADFNDDGGPDLVVANDTQPNLLLMNTNEGGFDSIGVRAGVGYDENGVARAGMGIDVGDINNNGRQSIVIGNFRSEPLSLYTQIHADDAFQDLAGKARLTRPSALPLTFSAIFADFDFDGYLDLVTANGDIEPEVAHIRTDCTFELVPQIFRNNRDGRFQEITSTAGPAFQEPIVGRGIAYADVDNDGDLDLLITTNGQPAKLLRNDSDLEGQHWIRLKLVGNEPNIDAVGARVALTTGEMTQRRMVKTGSSYLSQSELTLTFGLGAADSIDQLRIIWPDGSKTETSKLTVNQIHTIRQSDTALTQAGAAR